MSRMSYADQLKHPLWQRKRLECMQNADWRCERCGDGGQMLNVHHREYRKGAMAWDYQVSELQCLCRHCHGLHHGHAVPPTSLSAKRTTWELLADYHLQACVIGADDHSMSSAEVDALARRLCAADGNDYERMADELRA